MEGLDELAWGGGRDGNRATLEVEEDAESDYSVALQSKAPISKGFRMIEAALLH